MGQQIVFTFNSNGFLSILSGGTHSQLHLLHRTCATLWRLRGYIIQLQHSIPKRTMNYCSQRTFNFHVEVLSERVHPLNNKKQCTSNKCKITIELNHIYLCMGSQTEWLRDQGFYPQRSAKLQHQQRRGTLEEC